MKAALRLMHQPQSVHRPNSQDERHNTASKRVEKTQAELDAALA